MIKELCKLFWLPAFIAVFSGIVFLTSAIFTLPFGPSLVIVGLFSFISIAGYGMADEVMRGGL